MYEPISVFTEIPAQDDQHKPPVTSRRRFLGYSALVAPLFVGGAVVAGSLSSLFWRSQPRENQNTKSQADGAFSILLENVPSGESSDTGDVRAVAAESAKNFHCLRMTLSSTTGEAPSGAVSVRLSLPPWYQLPERAHPIGPTEAGWSISSIEVQETGQFWQFDYVPPEEAPITAGLLWTAANIRPAVDLGRTPMALGESTGTATASLQISGAVIGESSVPVVVVREENANVTLDSERTISESSLEIGQGQDALLQICLANKGAAPSMSTTFLLQMDYGLELVTDAATEEWLASAVSETNYLVTLPAEAPLTAFAVRRLSLPIKYSESYLAVATTEELAISKQIVATTTSPTGENTSRVELNTMPV